MGIKSGLLPLFEVIEGRVVYTYDCRKTAKGRIPVKDFLVAQGRFAHLIPEDIEYIQKRVDEMWEEWDIPGVAPLKTALKGSAAST